MKNEDLGCEKYQLKPEILSTLRFKSSIQDKHLYPYTNLARLIDENPK